MNSEPCIGIVLSFGGRGMANDLLLNLSQNSVASIIPIICHDIRFQKGQMEQYRSRGVSVYIAFQHLYLTSFRNRLMTSDLRQVDFDWRWTMTVFYCRQTSVYNF